MHDATVVDRADTKLQSSCDGGRSPVGGRSFAQGGLAALGTVPFRAIVGDRARGLLGSWRQLVFLSARSHSQPSVPLGRGRLVGNHRSVGETVFRTGVVERPRSDSEGTSLRPVEPGRQSRRDHVANEQHPDHLLLAVPSRERLPRLLKRVLTVWVAIVVESSRHRPIRVRKREPGTASRLRPRRIQHRHVWRKLQLARPDLVPRQRPADRSPRTLSPLLRR